MEYPWIKGGMTDDDRLAVSFDDVVSANDGDTCISCITHSAIKDVSGAVCIDVGADLGWWARFCKYVNGTSHVYAFEPNPATFPSLEKFSSDTFHVFNSAVSDTSGEINMEFEDSNSNSRSNTGTAVSTQKLDFIFDSVDTVSIIKIDTEGHDITIVRSLQPYFSRIQTLIFEFTTYWSGIDHDDCIKNSADALNMVYNAYPYVYIVSRRTFPILFRITDEDHISLLVLLFMKSKLQVDIVCSVNPIDNIEVKDDINFLKAYHCI